MKLATRETPVTRLESFGQDVWLDYIDRQLIRSGYLRQLIEEDGLSGIAYNVEAYRRAVQQTGDYDEQIRRLHREGRGPEQIRTEIVLEDVRQALDLFRPLYDDSQGLRGLVSVGLSPHIARDAGKTVNQARQIWKQVGRPNLMIEIPATGQCLSAIRQCIREGINVNVTLLTGLPRYTIVMEKYIRGLEQRSSDGKDVHSVRSVASWFVSRLDRHVDPLLEKIMLGGPYAQIAEELHGQSGVMSAKVAYQMFQEIFATRNFRRLADQGAQPQRLLFTCTSAENSPYSDVKYADSLIAEQTVDVMTMTELQAYRDHGNPAPRLEENPQEASRRLARLDDMEIHLDEIAEQLEREGLQRFVQSYDALIDAIKRKSV